MVKLLILRHAANEHVPPPTPPPRPLLPAWAPPYPPRESVKQISLEPASDQGYNQLRGLFLQSVWATHTSDPSLFFAVLSFRAVSNLR